MNPIGATASANADRIPAGGGPAGGPAGGFSATLEGLPPQRRVLHWCNAEPKAPWERALASFSATARLEQADKQGRLTVRSAAPQPYRDEFGALQPGRLQYRVEIEPGAWSAVRAVPA